MAEHKETSFLSSLFLFQDILPLFHNGSAIDLLGLSVHRPTLFLFRPLPKQHANSLVEIFYYLFLDEIQDKILEHEKSVGVYNINICIMLK